MAKRFTDSVKWDDQWFMEMTPPHKLLFFYILDKCDHVGVWGVNKRLAVFSIGMEIDFDSFLEYMGERIHVINEEKWWVSRFIEFQYGALKKDSRPHQSYMRTLEKHGLTKYIKLSDGTNSIASMRKRLTSTKKDAIKARDHYQCAYCGASGDLIECVVDHVVPLVKGGDNSDENLITTCATCNSKKSDLSLEEFYNKYNGVYKDLHRVSKILDTLKEKEEEEDKVKDKVKDKDKEDSALIVDHWNVNTANLAKCRKLTDNITRSINGLISDGYGVEDIVRGISTYNYIVNGEQYFFNYKWNLLTFLKQANGCRTFADVTDDKPYMVKQDNLGLGDMPF